MTCFEGDNEWYDMAGLFWAVPQVSNIPWGEPDGSLNRTALSNSTVGDCKPIQAVKQPVTLKSFAHWMLLLSDELTIWYILL